MCPASALCTRSSQTGLKTGFERLVCYQQLTMLQVMHIMIRRSQKDFNCTKAMKLCRTLPAAGPACGAGPGPTSTECNSVFFVSKEKQLCRYALALH